MIRFWRRRPRPERVVRRVPAEIVPRRSPHLGAVTRGGFAAARIPA